MKKSLFLVLAATAFAALSLPLSSSIARAADDAAMPAEGQQAPTFTLPSQDGTPISLEQYRGKWVVLYF
ncbi:MAG: redoxin domain-containing protein, partial [Terracidiphilus sp.]